MCTRNTRYASLRAEYDLHTIRKCEIQIITWVMFNFDIYQILCTCHIICTRMYCTRAERAASNTIQNTFNSNTQSPELNYAGRILIKFNGDAYHQCRSYINRFDMTWHVRSSVQNINVTNKYKPLLHMRVPNGNPITGDEVFRWRATYALALILKHQFFLR